MQKPKEVQNGGAEETLRKDNECLWLSNETLSKTNRLLQEENRTLSEECKSLRGHSEALSKVNVTLKDANQTLLEENKSLRSNSEAREKSLRQEVKRAEREHLKANEQLQRFYNSQRGENERLVQRNTNISFTNRQQIEALTKERDQLRAALDRQIYVANSAVTAQSMLQDALNNVLSRLDYFGVGNSQMPRQLEETEATFPLPPQQGGTLLPYPRGSAVPHQGSPSVPEQGNSLHPGQPSSFNPAAQEYRPNQSPQPQELPPGCRRFEDVGYLWHNSSSRR